MQSQTLFSTVLELTSVPRLRLLDEAEDILSKGNLEAGSLVVLNNRLLIYGCRVGVYWVSNNKV